MRRIFCFAMVALSVATAYLFVGLLLGAVFGLTLPGLVPCEVVCL